MKPAAPLAALLLAVAAPAAAGTARVQAWFTPGDDATGAIVARLDAARDSVRLAAYLFTDRRIAAALARAARRGVAVDVVADARQFETGGFPVAGRLARAGVRVWLQGEYAAFHDKVIVIDAGTDTPVVLTGSFNFTPSAQSRNAENLVALAGSPALAARFAADFERHRAGAARLQ